MQVNDVHSQLNRTEVADVAAVDSLEAIQRALMLARRERKPVAVAGGRHAMGGQQFCSGGVLLDTRGLNRVLAVDGHRGTIEVEAGMQWPRLLKVLQDASITFAQKQTGADDLSLGGAVSANVHGRGLTMRPFIDDVESLVVVDADGQPVRCSRDERRDLFELVVGGYGLFGVVYAVELRLVPRRTLERVVELATTDEIVKGFERRIAEGFLYGDFQFAIDSNSEDFLRRGVFSCYRPVPDQPLPPEQRALSPEDWQRLLHLAHTDKSRAFGVYARHYLATSGQLYRSDAHQFAFYAPDYHAAIGPGGEMITEIYVPRARLADFMRDAADMLRVNGADVVYGTVRLIERDDESFLAWAREPWACIVFNLHVDPAHAACDREAFRELIDLAIAYGGSYYLTYHRWATRTQVEACHPRFVDFLHKKLQHDSDELFQSEWYRHYRTMFRAELELEDAA
jgi:FAD/FMN-containing dehydrogenase